MGRLSEVGCLLYLRVARFVFIVVLIYTYLNTEVGCKFVSTKAFMRYTKF